jgi:lysophospholipase L1-like esterase
MADGAVTAFVGDSLTAGGRWAEWFPDDGAINFGVGGDTTEAVLARLDDVVAAAPDTVLLLIGTNDLAWRRSAEHIVRNLETILVRLRKALPDTQLLAQSVMPREAVYADTIREINRHLWQFAPTVRAQYLDLWPSMADAEGGLDSLLSPDSLHLNEAGYDVWVAELRGALEAMRDAPPSSRPIVIPREHRRR